MGNIYLLQHLCNMRDLILITEGTCTDGKTHDHIWAVKIFYIPWEYTRSDLQPFFRNTCKNIFQNIIDFLAFLSAVKVFLHLRICLFPEHATVAFPLLIDQFIHIRREIRHKAWQHNGHGIHFIRKLPDKCLCHFMGVYHAKIHRLDIHAENHSLMPAAG